MGQNLGHYPLHEPVADDRRRDDDRLGGARPGPKPAHPIAIWLGTLMPRALALTGRVADGWIPEGYGPVGVIIGSAL